MNWLVVFALLPLIWRLSVQFLPAQWTEPYAYWDADTLNDGLAKWSNMGYWATGKESFSEANEALARRLLTFADASRTDLVLDIAHGAGDSLLIHLESNPKHLVAIASLPSDTETAQRRVNQYLIEHAGHTETTWYTGSASFRPSKDFDHPLYPMRGFLGESSPSSGSEDEIEVEEQVVFSDEDDSTLAEEKGVSEPGSTHPEGPEPYDLVYILDSIYHFPPSLGSFVASVRPSLRKGTGVLAYTDIIAPPSLSHFPGKLLANILSTLLRVPTHNLASGPKTLAEYKKGLTNLGYTDVRVEDWTEHVFPGLAANLNARGGAWPVVGWLADKAAATGWKYVAVRATRAE